MSGEFLQITQDDFCFVCGSLTHKEWRTISKIIRGYKVTKKSLARIWVSVQTREDYNIISSFIMSQREERLKCARVLQAYHLA